MNKEIEFCIYRTSHPTGFYYCGKGQTHAVLSGAYKGSGTKLRAAFFKYPKSEWTSVVLQSFPFEGLNAKGKSISEEKAFAAEKALVNEEMLFDPWCLNTQIGGRSWHMNLSADMVAKKSKAISNALKGKKRGPQKQSTVEKRRATLLTKEVSEKLGHSKGKKFPERGPALSKAILESPFREARLQKSKEQSELRKQERENYKQSIEYKALQLEKKAILSKKRSEFFSGEFSPFKKPYFVNGILFDSVNSILKQFNKKYLYQVIMENIVETETHRLTYIKRKIIKTAK